MTPKPWSQQNEYDDLAGFDANYQAQAAFKPGIDTLPDGSYDFEITAAALDRINQDRVLRLALRSSTGLSVEFLYWLNDQRNINRLGADLCILGFDADRWGSAQGRSLAVELPRAVARLKGKQFKAQKVSRKGTGQYADKVYHDLHLVGLLGSTGRPPAASSPAPATPPPSSPGGIPDGEDIPF